MAHQGVLAAYKMYDVNMHQAGSLTVAVVRVVEAMKMRGLSLNPNASS